MTKTADLFIRAEHADLIKKLNEWDIAYHQNDAPIVDDATYDAAKKRALEIEEMYPELARNGASHRWAAQCDWGPTSANCRKAAASMKHTTTRR